MIDFRKMQKEKALGELNKFIDNLMDTNTYLVNKLENYNRDEEIANLMRANERLRTNSLHILSEQEEADAKAFREEHWNNCKGNTRYILEGTGIGTGVTVQCTKCNRTKNITDTSNW
jgi:antirestriction protein